MIFSKKKGCRLREKYRRPVEFTAWRMILVIMILTMIMPVVAAGEVDSRIGNIRDSIVRVACFDKNMNLIGHGSGFAIGEDEPIKYIITNWHVAEPNPDGIYLWRSRDYLIKAKVIIPLPYTDLAVLELETELHMVPPVTFGSSENEKDGNKVYAFGFPASADILSGTFTGNSEDVTITDGIISSIKTTNVAQGAQPVKIFQTNADINPGNSGGPLVNSKGYVIGINTWGVKEASGTNGAIRTEELLKVLNQRGILYKKSGSINIILIAAVGSGAAILLLIILAVVILMKKNSRQPVAVAAGGGALPKPVKQQPFNYQPAPQMQDVLSVGSLNGISGYFEGSKIEITGETIIIGRDPRICQVVFPQSTTDISRKHCTLHYDGVGRTFILEDNSSSNGTFLSSGEKLIPGKPYYLKSGDKFYLSDEGNVFVVRIER